MFAGPSAFTLLFCYNDTMKILIAPDSFKGSLTSAELCSIIGRAAKDFMQSCDVAAVPAADGGEGTAECIITSCDGKKMITDVHDPLGRPLKTFYGMFTDPQGRRAAVIESAAASGLMLTSEEDRDILRMTTRGTGEQILAAIAEGCEVIYLGMGGTGTNDGGIGLAAALGCTFYDRDGYRLEPLPVNLGRIDRIDISGARETLKGVKIILLCDVDNPLLGPSGAAAVYGPQKGIYPELIAVMDSMMENYINALEIAGGRSVRSIRGAGAAGGLGACIMAIAEGELRAGADTVLELAGFDRLLEDTDLVITGEGRMDSQTLRGKVAYRVASVCAAAGIPCAALVGTAGEGADRMYEHGITRIYEAGKGLALEEAVERAEELCYEAASGLIRDFCLRYGEFMSGDCFGIAADDRRRHIRVAAAVIREDDRIFAAERGYGDYKGWWEFPGGKLEEGEEPEEALVREIREELNTDIEVGEHLATVEYDYPGFHVTLECYWCTLSGGEPEPTEAAAVEWLRADELMKVNWLPSDTGVLKLIGEELSGNE